MTRRHVGARQIAKRGIVGRIEGECIAQIAECFLPAFQTLQGQAQVVQYAGIAIVESHGLFIGMHSFVEALHGTKCRAQIGP